MDALTLAKKIARLAADKKAEQIVVLDMREVVNYCDYFVICSGTSSRHAKAVASGIDEGLHELGIKVRFKQGVATPGRKMFSIADAQEGVPEERIGHWVLLDMGDVVTHIFESDSRSFYGLEYLWQGAVVIDWEK
ncbi:MAG: RsfS/YbeB/iojap family protein [Candidatus Omnitrophica bacterium]|nr:RsfS/YbeB/iojap family protein [Candidatus Omnitrophota bacterium]